MSTTLIIGNGLGMAVDSSYFSLDSGLEKIKGNLKQDEINIISLGKKFPKSENELEAHHKILSACLELKKHNSANLRWLGPNGEKFPDLYQNYIYQVAKYFYSYSKKSDKLNYFADELVSYIKKNLCHIATLNYDKLLYKALMDRGILKAGFDDLLVDGILRYKGGFDSENLRRLNGHNFGWYLHLHGSPHFKTQKNGNIFKCTIDQLPDNFEHNGEKHNNIVLANTKLKPSIISNSELLDSYFDYFNTALFESERIIIFGYSGNDIHVNDAIKRGIFSKEKILIEVVEWKDINMTHSNREKFWKDTICPNEQSELVLRITRLPDILDYKFNF